MQKIFKTMKKNVIFHKYGFSQAMRNLIQKLLIFQIMIFIKTNNRCRLLQITILIIQQYNKI